MTIGSTMMKFLSLRWITIVGFIGAFCWHNIFDANRLLLDTTTTAKPNNMTLKPFQFPSKEERLQHYMGDWYEISSNISTFVASRLCNDVKYFDSNKYNDNQADAAFIFDSTNIQNHTLKHYTNDIQHYLLPQHDVKSQPRNRLIISMGDQHPSEHLPVIMKSREIIKWSEDSGNGQPIIALLNTKRHYRQVTALKRMPFLDIPWRFKRPQIVWRGAKTGFGNGIKREQLVESFLKSSQSSMEEFEEEGDDIHDHLIPIDVAFRPRLTMRQMLKSKYLLSLEGNDVSTGLKWMLYSNSVVLMPPITHVSWAMEDHLQPYVHYIPLKSDLSDLQSQLQWAEANDRLCQQISKQATQYIKNLYTSQKARRDNQWIHTEIVSRYQEQFGDIIDKCPLSSTPLSP